MELPKNSDYCDYGYWPATEDYNRILMSGDTLAVLVIDGNWRAREIDELLAKLEKTKTASLAQQRAKWEGPCTNPDFGSIAALHASLVAKLQYARLHATQVEEARLQYARHEAERQQRRGQLVDDDDDEATTTQSGDNDDDAQNDDEPRRERKRRSIQLHIQLLRHASACRDLACSSDDCRRMKVLLKHGAACQVRVQGGCAICRRLWSLLQTHAVQCQRDHCPVLSCRRLKEERRQALRCRPDAAPADADEQAQDRRAQLELLLQHALECRDVACELRLRPDAPSCRMMKAVLEHGDTCRVPGTSARPIPACCARYWSLLHDHATQCQREDCSVPSCRSLNDALRQRAQEENRAALVGPEAQAIVERLETSGGLAPGWVAHQSRREGRVYFCHEETSTTQWEPPLLRAAAPTAADEAAVAAADEDEFVDVGYVDLRAPWARDAQPPAGAEVLVRFVAEERKERTRTNRRVAWVKHWWWAVAGARDGAPLGAAALGPATRRGALLALLHAVKARCVTLRCFAHGPGEGRRGLVRVRVRLRRALISAGGAGEQLAPLYQVTI